MLELRTYVTTYNYLLVTLRMYNLWERLTLETSVYLVVLNPILL